MQSGSIVIDELTAHEVLPVSQGRMDSDEAQEGDMEKGKEEEEGREEKVAASL